MERPAAVVGDADLVERVRNGDTAAFAGLYERYADGIHDFALRMAGNHEDASDITQDTFVRAYRSIGDIANPHAFKSWLFAIARNNALNTITRTRPHGTVPLDVQRAECPGLDIPDPDRMSDPALLTEARATAHLVWEAAAGLSPDEYALLDLHVRRELGGAELAKLLGTSANSMYVRLNRLRASFERSARAMFLLRGAGRNCDALQRELRESPAGALSPGVVRIADRHRSRCPACTAAVSRLSAPAEVFGALSLVAAGTSFKGILAILGLGAAAAGAGATASSAGTGAGVASGATATATSSGVGAGMAATVAAHAPLLVSVALAAVGLGGLLVTLTLGNVFDRGGGETASASDDPSPQPAIATSTPTPTEPPATQVPPSSTATATGTPATSGLAGSAPRPSSSPDAGAPPRPSPSAIVRGATPTTTPTPTSTPTSASTSTSITTSAASPTPVPTQPVLADEPTAQPDPPTATATATPTNSPTPSPTATPTAVPPPALSLLVAASVAILQAPGGQITLEITVRNTGSTAASLDSLDVGGGGSCPVPRQLEPGDTYTCSTTIDVVGAAGQVISGAVVATFSGDGGSDSAEAAWEVTITPLGPYLLDVSFALGLPLGHVVVNISNPGSDDVVVEEVSASGVGVGNGETTCKGEETGGDGGGASSKGRLALPAGASASCTIKLKLNPLSLGLWPLTVTVTGVTASGRAAHGLAQLLLGD